MLERLRFALGYALHNMLRNRQRTAFALLCIAAGVATVVALRTLGLMLTDALTSNARAFLRGDIRVEGGDDGGLSVFGSSESSRAFSAINAAEIDEWASSNNIEVTYMLNSELVQVAVVTDGRAGRPGLAMGNFIDPEAYPFYDIIRADEPSGVLLADLFDGPNQTVIGRRLATQIGAKVGDQVRVGAAEALYTVTGIVPDSAESTFDNPMGLMFSFVYLDRAQLGDFGISPGSADRAYLKFPPDLKEADVAREIRSRWHTANPDTPRLRTGNWDITTAAETLESNALIADVVSRFVLLLSVVGLVIGGVGIINTMLVAVNRRSMEIAVLKTLGMQGGDVSLLFLVEAVIAGLIGSLVGIVLGFALSLVARDLGQQAFAMALPWRLYPDPIVLGMVLGLAVTVFFSFLPTLVASRIRPSLVLRQGSIPMVRAGCLATLLSLAALIVGIGLLVDFIIGSSQLDVKLPPLLTPGIVGAAVVFALLGVVVALMWVLVWLLGRLPSFRNPNLQIAVRGLTTHRGRTAFSLLALIIGMTALSGTLIMARSLNILLYTSISEPMGGNVIIIALPLAQSAIHARLDALPAVNGYRDVRFATSTQLESIDGERRFQRFADEDDPQSEFRLTQLEMLLGVNVHGNLPRGTLVDGRFLGPDDAGKPYIVIPYIPELDAMGVGIGSQFTYRMGGSGVVKRSFEVVGIVAPDERAGVIPFSLNDSAAQAPYDMIDGGWAIPFDFVIVDVRPEAVGDVMASIAAIPGLFVFDITLFDSIITRLMNQLAALPLLIAGLSLFAATALIATTVSLATLERRRQIATLKAIGVGRWYALGQLLIENGIVGVTGGIISLLPTVLILLLVPSLTSGIVRLPAPLDLIALMLALSVAITLAATLLTSWSASGEKPLAALRYE